MHTHIAFRGQFGGGGSGSADCDRLYSQPKKPSFFTESLRSLLIEADFENSLSVGTGQLPTVLLWLPVHSLLLLLMLKHYLFWRDSRRVSSQKFLPKHYHHARVIEAVLVVVVVVVFSWAQPKPKPAG